MDSMKPIKDNQRFHRFVELHYRHRILICKCRYSACRYCSKFNTYCNGWIETSITQDSKYINGFLYSICINFDLRGII
jgi:hypothetical protein